MTPLPFVTDDSQLALCLEMVGQHRVRIENQYSEKKLKEIGCETIKEAMERGKPGKIIYGFDRTDQTTRLVEAYYDQRRKNERQEPTAADPRLSPSDIVRIAVSALMLRKQYVDLWKTGSVMIRRGGDSTFTPTEKLTVTRDLLAANPRLVKDGKLVLDGREYAEGDEIVTAGVMDVSPMSVVSAATKPELRAEAGL